MPSSATILGLLNVLISFKFSEALFSTGNSNNAFFKFGEQGKRALITFEFKVHRCRRENAKWACAVLISSHPVYRPTSNAIDSTLGPPKSLKGPLYQAFDIKCFKLFQSYSSQISVSPKCEYCSITYASSLWKNKRYNFKTIKEQYETHLEPQNYRQAQKIQLY